MVDVAKSARVGPSGFMRLTPVEGAPCRLGFGSRPEGDEGTLWIHLEPTVETRKIDWQARLCAERPALPLGPIKRLCHPVILVRITKFHFEKNWKLSDSRL